MPNNWDLPRGQTRSAEDVIAELKLRIERLERIIVTAFEDGSLAFNDPETE